MMNKNLENFIFITTKLKCTEPKFKKLAPSVARAVVEVAGYVGDSQFRQEPARFMIELLLHERDLLGRAQVHHAAERLAVVEVGVGPQWFVPVRHLVAVHVAVRARGAVFEAGADVGAAVVEPGDFFLVNKLNCCH